MKQVLSNPVRRTQFVPLDVPEVGRLTLISELGQETGSFKFRAAWNVVSKVDSEHFLAASSVIWPSAPKSCTTKGKKQQFYAYSVSQGEN